jgi:hypothetical protein
MRGCYALFFSEMVKTLDGFIALIENKHERFLTLLLVDESRFHGV